MKITESSLRELVRRAVRAKYLNETTNFTAIRKLTIAAQEAAMNFEKTIVGELGLLEPDKMDDTSQRVYLQVMNKLKSKLVEAVIDAAKDLQELPKEPGDEEEQPSSSLTNSTPSLEPSVPTI